MTVLSRVRKWIKRRWKNSQCRISAITKKKRKRSFEHHTVFRSNQWRNKSRRYNSSGTWFLIHNLKSTTRTVKTCFFKNPSPRYRDTLVWTSSSMNVTKIGRTAFISVTMSSEQTGLCGKRAKSAGNIVRVNAFYLKEMLAETI